MFGDVGAVYCIEASRLARNGRDWHHLIDLCALAGTLVVDPDGAYDPRIVNDGLLLGLKGTDVRKGAGLCIGIGGVRIARYEASLASRRYELVDPQKRHVARELEARWNTALERVTERAAHRGALRHVGGAPKD